MYQEFNQQPDWSKNSTTVTDRQPDEYHTSQRGTSPDIRRSRGATVTRKLSAIGKVMFLTEWISAVSERALWSDCHMHLEKTVSLKPDAHMML